MIKSSGGAQLLPWRQLLLSAKFGGGKMGNNWAWMAQNGEEKKLSQTDIPCFVMPAPQ